MMPDPSQDARELKNRFLERSKLMAVREDAEKLAQSLRTALAAGQTEALRGELLKHYPPDLADAMFFLNDAEDAQVFALLDTIEGAEVLDEVDECTRGLLAAATAPERLARMLEQLPADEATDVVQAMPSAQAESVLALVRSDLAQDIRSLLVYPKQSAGGIMSLGYVAVPDATTASGALDAFRQKKDAEPVNAVLVTGAQGNFLGSVDLRDLLVAPPTQPLRELLLPNPVSVPPAMDREQVVSIVARYDLTTLPVVEAGPEGKLLGVITADDIIDVLHAEDTEDVMRMAGSDAEEMERRSPVRIALLRLPWIMATMFIELFAGYMIHIFDATLGKIILLASFMPIISAISGNTGLQSATIIVRGLSGGQIKAQSWRHAVLRQLKTTLILGSATGLTLGIIGALWYGKPTFGAVVAIGMFAAVNIAGVVGTVVPLTSKRLGFDPAITSGPFETAFQDVVGISIFLGLATLLLPYML